MNNNNRKGQAVFEFLIAAMFFFYIVFYVINHLNTTAIVFSNDFYMNSLEHRAFQISEILLHQEGKWNGSFPEAIGLSAGWPVLNETKIQYFQAYCGDNRSDMLKKLDIDISDGHEVMIEITNTSGTVMKCHRLPEGVINTNIRRFALSQSGEILTMSIWVW